MECLCGSDAFERVMVQRLPYAAFTTDFVACMGCSAMYFRPFIAYPVSDGLVEGAKDAAKDYRKPGRKARR
jgi:hypothetical protein